LQRKLQGGQGRITEFNARLDEVNNQIAALDGHIAETQQQLTGLPDFSRIAPNPIDWLNQLARSFKTAVNMRDGEEETRDVMRTELADLRVAIAGDAAIFEGSGNFAEELVLHQGKKRQWEARSTQVEEHVRHNRSLRDELADTILGQFILSLGCILFLLLLLGAYLGNTHIVSLRFPARSHPVLPHQPDCHTQQSHSADPKHRGRTGRTGFDERRSERGCFAGGPADGTCRLPFGA